MSFDKCMCWNQRVSRAPNKNHVCMENVFFFFPFSKLYGKWKMENVNKHRFDACMKNVNKYRFDARMKNVNKYRWVFVKYIKSCQ